MPYNHSPSHAFPPPPPPHSHTSPWPHSEATPGGHALRPGTFAASHLAHTSHILSHPHSLSPSDSSIQQAERDVPYQPSGRAGTAGHCVHLAGTRQTELAVRSQCPHSLLHRRFPLFPLRSRQTDRHVHTLALWPRPRPTAALFLITGQCACLLAQLEMVRE